MAELLYAEQLGEVTTSSTSPQVAKTASPTVNTAADFFCLFTYEVNFNNTASEYVTVEGYVEGTRIGAHQYLAETTSDWHPGTFMAVMPLGTGARTLELRFQVSSGATTGKVRNVRLLAWSLAIAGYASRASAQLAIHPDTVAKVAEVVLPAPTAGGTYLAFWAGSLMVGNTIARASLTTYIYQGSTQVGFAGAAELHSKLAGTYAPVAGFRLFGVAPSTAPLAITVGLRPTSSSGSASVRDLRLVVLKIDGATDFTVAGFQERLLDQDFATTALTAVASTTFTAASTYYLLLGTMSLRSSSASGDSQYDLRHAGSVRQGVGLIEAGDSGQRLSFIAFDYAAYSAGSVTDDLRAARSGSSGTTTARDSTVLTLKVGLQANPVDPLTIQELIQFAMEKLIDAESVTFSDTIELVKALDAASTVQPIALEDLITFLSEREVADHANLADGVLAILLPRRQAKLRYRPVQLVELLLPAGTRYYATRDIIVSHPQGLWPVKTFFLGVQMTFVEPPEFSVDAVLGFQPVENLTLTFGNLKGHFTDLRSIEARKAMVRVWEYDVANEEFTRLYLGFVSARPAIGKQATFELSMQSLDLFQRELPLRSITTDEFPDVAPEALGRPITLCWGHAYRLPMRLIRAWVNPEPAATGNPGDWVYLAYEKPLAAPALGWPTPVTLPRITSVYRDGRLIDASEYLVHYTTNEYSAKYVTVEFFRDQGDRVLTFDAVQEDPTWRNPATIVQGLLALYGQEKVDAASFAQAAATLNAAYASAGTGPAFDFALAEPMRFLDVLNELLFRLRLGRADDGAWTVTVDQLATTAALQLGQGVGTIQNAEIGPLLGRTLEEMPAAVELAYGYSRGVRDDNARFVFTRSLPAAPIAGGQRVRRELHFLWDHFTADAWIQFFTATIVTGEETCTAVVGREGRLLRRGMVVLVNVPAPSHRIVNEVFRVAAATLGIARRTLTLERHGPEIYAFSRNVDGDPDRLPLDPTVPDYTFTPPPKPAGLVVQAWYAQRASGAGGDGSIVVAVLLRALLPASPKNGTSVVFKWRLAGEPLLAHPGDETPIGTSQWGSGVGVPGTIGNLKPGLRYDFYAYIHNANNDRGSSVEENAQDGDIVVLEDVLVPDRSQLIGLAPVDITGWAIREYAAGSGGIHVHIYPPEPRAYPEVAGYVIYRAPGGAGGVAPDTASLSEANVVSRGAANDFHDTDVGTDTTSPWFYWARLIDQAGFVTEGFTPPLGPVYVKRTTVTEISLTEEYMLPFGVIAPEGDFVELGQVDVAFAGLDFPTQQVKVTFSATLQVQLAGSSLSADDRLYVEFWTPYDNYADATTAAGQSAGGPAVVQGAASGRFAVTVTGSLILKNLMPVQLRVYAIDVSGNATFSAGDGKIAVVTTQLWSNF